MKEIIVIEDKEQIWTVNDSELKPTDFKHKVEKVPETWFELIDNVVDEFIIIGENFKEAYKKKVIRENEFTYRGYSFSRKGEIHIHYENGARRSILQGCSVKQMFLFLQILKEPLKICDKE